jgi:hypothetical protein
MTSPGSGSRFPSASLGRVVRLVLVIVTVVSVCALFAQVWSRLGDDIDSHAHERDGLRYLTALNKVTAAVVNAESGAVAGDTVSRSDVSSAVAGVTAVDTRLGDELGAQERWAAIRVKIEALPDKKLTDADAAYTAYTEVTDLLLALYTRVRVESGLDRDPDPVSFYLQDGATQELPEVIVRSGRYNDLAVLASAQQSRGRPETPDSRTAAAALQAQASAAGVQASFRAQISEGVSDLNDDLQAAVETSAKGTLGTALLQQLDSFQRSADQLAPPPITLAAGALANPVEVGKQRNETQSSAFDLMGTLMTVLDKSVADQRDSASSARLRASVLFLATLLLILATAVVGILGGGRRSRRRPTRPVADGSRPDPKRQADADPYRAYAEATSGSNDAYSDQGAPRWERSGAPR